MSDQVSEIKSAKHPTTRGIARNVEKFPMASFLVSGARRPHLVAFFNFARELDDLSDNTDLMPQDKISKLNLMEQALKGEVNDPSQDTCLRMAASLKVTGVNMKHCLDMINATKQGVEAQEFANWDELLNYCSASVSPIGRYLLDLYGENEKAYPLADALCNALQIINHIQDCRVDYINLDKVNIPKDILSENNVPLSDFEKDQCTDELRQALNQCLEKVSNLLEQASTLPEEISSKSLAVETAVILRVAKKLTKGLRKKDPLNGPIMLNRFQYISAGFRGVFSFPLT